MTTPNEWETDPLRTAVPSPQHAATPLADSADGYAPERNVDLDPLADPDRGDGSGPDGAEEQAQHVAGTAAEQGSQVAGTAKDEAQQVAGEAKDKAADLLTEAKSHADEQSRTQLQNLAAKLQEVSGELDSMVEGSDVQGTVTDLARQLSVRTRALSSHLADREPKDVIEDVRGFARQRPAVFLGGALVAGVVAGRMTRGAKKAHDTGNDDVTPNATPATTASSHHDGISTDPMAGGPR